ncbi:unnamed protein product, partial [Iphiclides podalirius]
MIEFAKEFSLDIIIMNSVRYSETVRKVKALFANCPVPQIICTICEQEGLDNIDAIIQYDARELPGQQLPAAHAHSPLDHVLNLGIQLPPGCQRLTGIIATIGKSSNDIETMQKMMAAGMNVALLNLSFGTQKEHVETIKMLRKAAKEYSVTVGKHFPLAIAARLPGRKIRTGCISDVANGIMITRQELGSDISPTKLVIAQKDMIARANEANVPVCLCAHLLSSMRHSKIPLRSELLDIADCIFDGADALVLSAETAIGISPVQTIKCMASASKEAEDSVWTMRMFHDYVEKTPVPCDQATAIAVSAVLAAYQSIAAAIIVVTATGKAAFLVAKYRPRCPIIAVTRYVIVARQMHLYRGIMPLIYEATPEADWETDLEQRINFCTKWAMQRGFVRVGDPLILVCSWKQGSEFTNTMRMVYATADIGVS